MTDYTPTAITMDGVAVTFNAAAAGDKITNVAQGGAYIHVKNGGGAPITVTIAPPGNTSYGVANPSKVVTVTNGTEKIISLLPAYANPSDGNKVALTWSATTSVTWAALRAAVS